MVLMETGDMQLPTTCTQLPGGKKIRNKNRVYIYFGHHAWTVQGSPDAPVPPPPSGSVLFPPFPLRSRFPPFLSAGFRRRFAPFLFLLRPLLVTSGMRLDLALLYTPKRRRSSRPVGLNMRVMAEWLRRLYLALRSPTRLISYCWGLQCKHAGTVGE